MSKAEWRIALDEKAEVVRCSKYTLFTPGTLSSSPYLSELLKDPDKRQGLNRAIITAEPIFISENISNYLRERCLTYAVLSADGDYQTMEVTSNADIYQSWLLSQRMPIANPAIRSGILVFERPWSVQNRLEYLTIRSIFFTMDNIMNEDQLGMRVAAFLDPNLTSMYLGKGNPHMIRMVLMPKWRVGSTFTNTVHTIEERWKDVMNGLAPPELSMVPKILGDGMAYAACMSLVVSFLRYAEEHIDAVRPYPQDKAVGKYARKLNVSSRIQVVHWRKEDIVPVVKESKDSLKIDWQCQWDVREHTRTYKKTGKTITIKSYRKGPDDKPYKAPNIRVHVADK